MRQNLFIILQKFFIKETKFMNFQKHKQFDKILISIILFFILFSLKSQTYVKVMIDQAEKLEVIADELFYETNNSIILGEDVIVQGGTTPYQYSWFMDYSHIGNSLYLEIPKPNSYSFFELNVSDEQNCSQKLNSNTLNIINNNISKIEIFPNPTQDYITIIPKNNNVFYNVFVFNNIGNIVHHEVIIGKTILNVNLASGLYFIEIENDNFSEFSKIIVL